MYDIEFHEGDTLAGARRRTISDGTDPEAVDTTFYVPGDWKIEDEYIESEQYSIRTNLWRRRTSHNGHDFRRRLFLSCGEEEWRRVHSHRYSPALIYSGYMMP